MALLLLIALLLSTSSLPMLASANSPYVNGTTLPKSLVVAATINGHNITQGSTLLYMSDNLTVTWRLNLTFWGQDASYKKVLIKLCYGAPSAVDRPWRKNNANLVKSKTCPFKIAAQPYHPEGNSTTWQAPDTIPGALYFVRAFVLNSTASDATPGENAVAFGQTTNATRTSNLFEVIPYHPESWTLTLTMVVISVTSYVCLFGYFFVEREMKKRK